MTGSLMGFAVLTVKIGTVIGTGFGVATMFQYFHDKDVKLRKKVKEEGDSNDHIEHLRKKVSATR